MVTWSGGRSWNAAPRRFRVRIVCLGRRLADGCRYRVLGGSRSRCGCRSGTTGAKCRDRCGGSRDVSLGLPRHRFVAAGSTGHIIWWAEHATADTLMCSSYGKSRVTTHCDVRDVHRRRAARMGVVVLGRARLRARSCRERSAAPIVLCAGLVMWAGLDIMTAVLDRVRDHSPDSPSS